VPHNRVDDAMAALSRLSASVPEVDEPPAGPDPG
jgi:hypothetical protein